MKSRAVIVLCCAGFACAGAERATPLDFEAGGLVSASITLMVSDKADQSYQLFEVLRAWDEGTATWNRASSSASWAARGAEGASDRGGVALGSIRAASTGAFTIALNAAGVAAVQRWVSDPRTNHGVVFAGTDNDNRLEFRSREDAKASRPRLEVSWAPGGGSPAPGPTPGSYRETCDGSAGIALDATHFLDFRCRTRRSWGARPWPISRPRSTASTSKAWRGTRLRRRRSACCSGCATRTPAATRSS